MNADSELWERSYEHIPFGAGEAVIEAAETRDLESAHRLMAACESKPPEVQIPQAPDTILSLLRQDADTLFSYWDMLVLNEALRYARVCREMARRMELTDPERALSLLSSAIMPESCGLVLDSHEAYTRWRDEAEPIADESLAELQAIVENKPEGGIESGMGSDFVLRFATAMARSLTLGSVLNTSSIIMERQGEWNFRINAHALTIENRLGNSSRVRQLKDKCMELLDMLLYLNKDLLNEVFGAVALGSVLWASSPLLESSAAPAPLPPFTQMAVALPAALPADATMRSELSHLLPVLRDLFRSELEPLLKSTAALHDRMDTVIDRLFDLDQRSKLTWAQVSRTAHQLPDYQEMKREIETSLASRLGSGWDSLSASSRKDLVDSEYVWQHCAKWGSGWRMAALGYCTTVERELKTSYKLVISRLFGFPQKQASRENLGDMIKLLENLKARLPKSKPIAPALIALLASIDTLWKINGIRIRAAHPKEQEISGEEAAWLKDTLLGQRPLLVTVLSVRPDQ